MSYQQHAVPSYEARASQYTKIEDETTGTIYYKHNITHAVSWHPVEFKPINVVKRQESIFKVSTDNK